MLDARLVSSCLSWPSSARPRLSLLSASVGLRENTLLRVNPGATPILPVQSSYFPAYHSPVSRVIAPKTLFRSSNFEPICCPTHARFLRIFLFYYFFLYPICLDHRSLITLNRPLLVRQSLMILRQRIIRWKKKKKKQIGTLHRRRILWLQFTIIFRFWEAKRF